MLAIWYGDAALELMRTHGRIVALWLVGVIVLRRPWWLVADRLAQRAEQTAAA